MSVKSTGKKLQIVSILAICVVACVLISATNTTKSAPVNYSCIRKHNKELTAVLHRCILIADSGINLKRISVLKTQYHLARKNYKQMECFIEYCAPFDVKYYINGPLVKKSEPEIGKRIVDPHGFQVIEEQLFGTDSINEELLKTELNLLKNAFITFEKKLEVITINNAQLIEMMQFELIRMSSLSLSGYDATYTQTNITECVYVLKGFEELLHEIKKKHPGNNFQNALYQKLNTSIKLAKSYCSQNKNYLSFDRLYFMTRHIKPLYSLLVKLHQQPDFPYTPVNYAINLNNEHLFEKSAYNLNYFSVQAIDTIGNALQAQLGAFLFFDPVLSGNNQRACASCHKPNMAFSDGMQKAIAFEQQQSLTRNTPSLLNTIFQKHFFYDGRARQLEHQINDVLHNQKEMNSSIDEMILKLNKSKEYQLLFKKAYAGSADTAISYYGILKAIGEYEKTLISMNSRFDQYIKGNYKQLSKQEINGYNLFSGKALCGSCHFFPLFNGLVPPVYNDTEYEVIGVPDMANSKTIDPDKGRIAISNAYIHQYAFKTSTVRNSQLTAPYMHNGIYKTLDEVIDFYNKGGGKGTGIDLPNQTLPFDSLGLSKKEIADIKAFMLSLTDTTGLTKKPARLPQFNDSKLNNRIIGGVY